MFTDLLKIRIISAFLRHNRSKISEPWVGDVDCRLGGAAFRREKASIGIYLTLEPPTKLVITEGVGKGYYHSDGWNKDYPRIQILTVEDILAGKLPHLPPNLQKFKQARTITAESKDQPRFGFQ